MTPTAVACDILKTLRAQRLDEAELATHCRIGRDCARRWLREFTAQGVLVCTEELQPTGRSRTVFTLAPAWGGQA